jgi:hypothetical protein
MASPSMHHVIRSRSISCPDYAFAPNLLSNTRHIHDVALYALVQHLDVNGKVDFVVCDNGSLLYGTFQVSSLDAVWRELEHRNIHAYGVERTQRDVRVLELTKYHPALD